MSNTQIMQKAKTALQGKTVAVTGTTGGIGKELCRNLMLSGANLIRIDRNAKKSAESEAALIREFNRGTKRIIADFTDAGSIRAAAEKLKSEKIDILFLNAGAYHLPEKNCDKTGLLNVYQINFAGPFYLLHQILPALRESNARVVLTGSIAHKFVVTDKNNLQFRGKSDVMIYGNAKRCAMFSLVKLFRDEKDITFAIGHPGVSPTGITAGYPKFISAVIKYPMKLLFMSPKKACMPVLTAGVCECPNGCWYGPRFFDVWGKPALKTIKAYNDEEGICLLQTAQKLCSLFE